MKRKIIVILMILLILCCYLGESRGAETGAVGRVRNVLRSSFDQLTVTADERAIHYVWIDNIDGNPEVYYKRCGYDRKDDSSCIRLTNNNDTDSSPVIEGDGEHIYIAWISKDEDILFSSSNDWGNTWNEAVVVERKPHLKRELLKIMLKGKDICLYSKDALAASVDGGKTWENQELSPLRSLNIEPLTKRNTIFAIAFYGDKVIHTVYSRTDERGYQFRSLVYRVSCDGGETWSEEILVSKKSEHFSPPAIAVTGIGDVGII